MSDLGQLRPAPPAAVGDRDHSRPGHRSRRSSAARTRSSSPRSCTAAGLHLHRPAPDRGRSRSGASAPRPRDDDRSPRSPARREQLDEIAARVPDRATPRRRTLVTQRGAAPRDRLEDRRRARHGRRRRQRPRDPRSRRSSAWARNVAVSRSRTARCRSAATTDVSIVPCCILDRPGDREHLDDLGRGVDERALTEAHLDPRAPERPEQGREPDPIRDEHRDVTEADGTVLPDRRRSGSAERFDDATKIRARRSRRPRLDCTALRRAQVVTASRRPPTTRTRQSVSGAERPRARPTSASSLATKWANVDATNEQIAGTERKFVVRFTIPASHRPRRAPTGRDRRRRRGSGRSTASGRRRRRAVPDRTRAPRRSPFFFFPVQPQDLELQTGSVSWNSSARTYRYRSASLLGPDLGPVAMLGHFFFFFSCEDQQIVEEQRLRSPRRSSANAAASDEHPVRPTPFRTASFSAPRSPSRRVASVGEHVLADRPTSMPTRPATRLFSRRLATDFSSGERDEPLERVEPSVRFPRRGSRADARSRDESSARRRSIGIVGATLRDDRGSCARREADAAPRPHGEDEWPGNRRAAPAEVVSPSNRSLICPATCSSRSTPTPSTVAARNRSAACGSSKSRSTNPSNRSSLRSRTDATISSADVETGTGRPAPSSGCSARSRCANPWIVVIGASSELERAARARRLGRDGGLVHRLAGGKVAKRDRDPAPKLGRGGLGEV